MMFTTVQKDELSIAMPKRPMTGAVADKMYCRAAYVYQPGVNRFTYVKMAPDKPQILARERSYLKWRIFRVSD